MLLLLATLLGILGCTGPAGDGGTTDSTPDEEETKPAGNLFLFAGGDAPVFQIVYPGKDGEAKAAAEYLQAVIKEKTGVEPVVTFDGNRSTEYEILIGNVARVESSDLIDEHSLGAQDFAIAVVGTKICLCATGAQASTMAVEYFVQKIAEINETEKTMGVYDSINEVFKLDASGTVTITSQSENYVEFSVKPGTPMEALCRISYTGDGAWRIQTKKKVIDEFDDIGASQRLSLSLGELPVLPVEKITASTKGDLTTLTTQDGYKVEINTKAFQMDFYTASGKLSNTITNITTNAGGSFIEGALLSNEAVFGTGERFNGANQRGKRIEMFTKDIWSMSHACYMAIPLLCTSRGSGFLINRYEHMYLDLGKASKNVWSAEITGAVMDCYVYSTEKISDVLKRYSDLSGYAEQPEEWTYGMIVCRYSPDLSQKWSTMIKPSDDGRGEGVYDSIAMMEKYDLPWTGILAEGWNYPDSRKHRDLKELCDYVHSLGKKFLVYMQVGNANSRMAGYNEEYMLNIDPNGRGEYTINLPVTKSGVINPDAGDPTNRTRTYLDITDPNAVEWFFNDYWEYLSKEIGVDGCKIDFCELIPENYEILYYDHNMPTDGSHHWYPTAFCAMFFEMLEQKAYDGMNFTRGGGIGSQRAPYMWAGDQARGWESLGFQVSAVLSSGLSGVPYMSYDMAGYQYGSMSKDLSYESQVFIRGTQFTAFTVCMQTHGKVRKSYQFAEESASYVYVTDIYRAYVKLHEVLTPYITEYCKEASTTGMPVMRHMVLHWQDDKNVYNLNDQYMFGDAFLVAPILGDAHQRNIYLPEGTWKDLNTGEVHTVGKEGKTLEDYEADIKTLPVFYNVNSTSETATPELIAGIEEIFRYVKSIWVPRR
jgi:alpha-glucosidase (family GH31 glycosyl hydrolase)